MKMSSELNIITTSEINQVNGGNKFCDCTTAISKDLKISTIQNSETECKNWCCNSNHEIFNDQCGEFYIWDLESSSNSEWIQCLKRDCKAKCVNER